MVDTKRDTRYPVYISRNKDWSGSVRLLSDAEIGEGFVHVPAGLFICGVDLDLGGFNLPRSEPVVADFVIAEHPVTMGAYLEYLNDVVARDGLDATKQRAPRPAVDAPYYLLETKEGLLALAKQLRTLTAPIPTTE